MDVMCFTDPVPIWAPVSADCHPFLCWGPVVVVRPLRWSSNTGDRGARRTASQPSLWLTDQLLLGFQYLAANRNVPQHETSAVGGTKTTSTSLCRQVSFQASAISAAVVNQSVSDLCSTKGAWVVLTECMFLAPCGFPESIVVTFAPI